MTLTNNDTDTQGNTNVLLDTGLKKSFIAKYHVRSATRKVAEILKFPRKKEGKKEQETRGKGKEGEEMKEGRERNKKKGEENGKGSRYIG